MNADFPIYDAHNHLQDGRLEGALPSVIGKLQSLPLRGCVVNGTRPGDWAAVAELARQHKWITPSFGLHPWYVNQVCESWRPELERFVRSTRCAIGEVGLDRWIEGYDSEKQEAAFVYQLQLAKDLRRPVSIHCLKAWGRLLEILGEQKLANGFLLHSYGGPAEMVQSFVALGGYFSLSGYFAHERKQRQREVFRTVPIDRLLLETDAPDMSPPDGLKTEILRDGEVGELNHPANIRSVYTFASELYNFPVQELASKVEQNFLHLFTCN